MCRVDETYDRCLSNEMTRNEWHEINYISCRILQEEEENLSQWDDWEDFYEDDDDAEKDDDD